MDYPKDACFEVRAALPLYVGGDLDRDELVAVEVHLESCPACRVAEGRARDAREVLTSSCAEGPTPDLWSGIQGQLQAEGLFASPIASTLEFQAPKHRLRLVPVGVLSAAAALVLAYLMAGFFTPGLTPEVSPGLAISPGSGGTVTTAVPVGHTEAPPHVAPRATSKPIAESTGGLRPLDEGEDPMYLRAREMRAEQGIVVPRPGGAMRNGNQPAGDR